MPNPDFYAYEDLSVAGTAVGFTAATLANAASYAMVLVENAAVRFTLHGTVPTASSGDMLNVGDRLILEGAAQVSEAKFISRDGGTATLRCHFGSM